MKAQQFSRPFPNLNNSEELLNKVPEPVIPGLPCLVKMHERYCKIGFGRSEQRTNQNNFVDWYVDKGFDARIFQ